MEEYTIDLTMHSVILPVYEKPELNILENTVLRYLRENRTKAYISNKLGINIGIILAGLKDKKIIDDNFLFRYKNAEDWYAFAKKEYKKGYIFCHSNKEMFFDALIYANELKFQNSLLANDLGHEYVPLDILDNMHIIRTFEVAYNAGQTVKNTLIRKISDLGSDKLKFMYGE